MGNKDWTRRLYEEFDGIVDDSSGAIRTVPISPGEGSTVKPSTSDVSLLTLVETMESLLSEQKITNELLKGILQ